MLSDLYLGDKTGFLKKTIAPDLDRSFLVRTLKAFKLYLFETFYLLFKSEKETSGSKNYQKSKFLFLRLLVLLQWLSFLWVWNMQLSSWTDYRTFWRALSYARFDTLCAENNILHFCTYFSLSLVVLCYSGLLLVGVLTYHNQKSPQALGFVLKGLLQFVCEVGYVPMVTLLLIVSKYTLEGETKVEEYFGEELESIRMSKGWAGAGIGGCLMLGVLKYLFVNLTTETRHCYSHHNITSKVSAQIVVLSYLFENFLIVIYIFVTKDPAYPQLYSTIIGAVLFFQVLKKIPYYLSEMNKFETVVYGILILESLLFQIAQMTNSASVLSVLSILLPPLVVFPIITLVDYRYSLIKIQEWEDLQYLNKVQDIERLIRPELLKQEISKEQGEKILRALSLAYDHPDLKRQKMLSILITHLCIYGLRRKSLAVIRLSNSYSKEGSLESNFQEFVCTKEIQKVIPEIEALDFLKFNLKMQSIYEQDEALCRGLARFWNELTKSNSNIDSLETQMKQLSQKIRELRSLYEDVIENHSKFEDGPATYASFIQSLLFDEEKALYYLRKLDGVKNANQNSLKDSKKLRFFDSSNVIFMVSGAKGSFGKVLYANQTTAAAFGLAIDEIVGSEFQMFIPPPYDFKHYRNLRNFLHYSASPIIDTPFIVKIPSGHVIEIDLFLELTAYERYPVFILVAKPRGLKREFALISETGTIYSHTPEFASCIGYENNSLFWANIEELVPEFKLSEQTPFKMQEFRDFALCYGYIPINKTQLNMVWAIKDEKQIRRMRTRKTFDPQILSLNNAKKDQSSREASYRNGVKFDDEAMVQSFSFSEASEKDRSKKNGSGASSQGQDSSSSNFAKTKASKALFSQSIRAIKFFQWILLATMMIVLATNIMIQVYINDAVTSQREAGLISKVSGLKLSLSKISYLTRTLHVKNSKNQDASSYYSRLSSEIENLDSLAKLSFMREISSCIGRDLDRFTVIENYYNPTLKKIKLYNALKYFTQFARNLQFETPGTFEYENDAYFLIINGVGMLHSELDAVLSDVVNCKTEAISELDRNVSVFIMVGSGVLILCLLFLVPNAISITRNFKMVWEKIKKLSIDNFTELKQTCQSRLTEFHNKSDIGLSENQSSKSTNYEIKYKGFRKYFVRLSIFGLLSLSYYLVSYFVFYQRCKVLLENKPGYIFMLEKQRILISEIQFWTKEVIYEKDPDYQNFKFQFYLNQTYPFETPSGKHQQVLESINDLINGYFEEDTEKEMGSETKKMLFNDFSGSKTVFQKGIFHFYQKIIEDYTYVRSLKTNLLEANDQLTQNSEKMTEGLEELKEVAISESLQSIENNKTSLLILAVIYIILTMLLYFFVYLPFLKSQKNELDNMKQICKFIPS